MTGPLTGIEPVRTRPLRRNAAFTRVFAGTTVSLLGTAVSTISLPLVAVAAGAHPFEIGLIAAAVWLPWLLVGLPAGAWADTYSPRRLIVAADLASAVLYAAVPVLVLTGHLSIWYLVLLALAAGITDVISQAALGVLPPMLVPDDDLESANAALQTAESTTDTLGGPGSSLLTFLFGVTGGVAANSVSFLVSAVLVGLTPETDRPPAPSDEPGPPLRRQIADGLVTLFRHPLLRRLALTGAVVNAGLTGFGVLHALFLIRELGLRPAALGLLLIGEGAGAVVGSALAPSLARRFGTARTVGIVAAATFPFALLLPLTTRGVGLVLFVAGTALPLVGIGAVNVLLRTMRQRLTSPELLGRVSSGSRVLGFGTAPVTALAAGALAGPLGYRLSYLLWALVLLAPAVSFVVRPLRDNTSMRDSTPAPS